ncbi:dihydrofolate reductase [Halorubrum vacuolatum]|uniref:dihydrofolate reductase n=1 Tax=Halorubrum vacuolatum TaxID=63740 RepID=A0A238VYN7_HALVU|nr:dihydrofolate reductase [Halorubrum vacuolatum]SNR39224.1 dihydrofolate reductase [Halorubrum vacuolatum]
MSGRHRSSDLEFVLVAAVAENGIIGADEDMPWHYPADLKRFKRLTTGHPVIVGRTTYESIVSWVGGPLPDRVNVVLSTRDLDLPEGATLANDLDEAIDVAREAAADLDVDTVHVIGGAAVYEAFLDRADRMEITEIPESPEGDTRFPEWDPAVWQEVDRKPEDELAFVTYERTAGGSQSLDGNE